MDRSVTLMRSTSIDCRNQASWSEGTIGSLTSTASSFRCTRIAVIALGTSSLPARLLKSRAEQGNAFREATVSEKTEKVRVAQELITDEEIPDSPRDDPEHLFWLEQGRKALTDSVSLSSVRAAATSLMTGLGAMQAIYIGVLGFADFIP